MNARHATPADIVAFWQDAGEKKWFVKDPTFDKEIRARFLKDWEAAKNGVFETWEESDDGLLALMILLDQFPRNMFRNDPKTFSTDAQALRLARLAVEKGLDGRIDASLRPFVYLPFEHSENIDDQKQSMALFSRLADETSCAYAKIHFDIIARFGRFPHRNKMLGRKTTEEEQKFLDEGGFAG